MDVASEEFEMENAALIPPPEITEDHSRGNKVHWVVELEKQLIEEVETSGDSSPVIFSVAKAFPASEQQFYIPSVISMGPYHFGRKELSRMEPHKIEALRRMQKRMHGRSMQSVVEKEILEMDKSIRQFYDKELSYSAIELAWMVTADSCFLFEFMLNYLRTRVGNRNFHKDCVVEGRYDEVLSPSLTNPTWKNILYDLALFENQIPLPVLQCLLAIAQFKCHPEKILGDILSRVAVLATYMVFLSGMPRPYKKQKTLHFLEVLYYRHVGWDLARYSQDAYSVVGRRSLDFGWRKSILSCCCPRWMRGSRDYLRRSFQCVREHVKTFRLKLPSAAELKKKGINLCVLKSKKVKPIQRVRFEEETSTLYLPEVRIDHFRHALLRNFIALEKTSLQYQPFPITSFVFFMNELVDSEDDVAVLREANIIKNLFGSNQEAAECFNVMTKSYYWSVGCKPIDDARVGIHKYLRRKYRILWHEFTSTYFGKPWLVAGSVAATLLLLMTVLQVFCLFYTCNSSS